MSKPTKNEVVTKKTGLPKIAIILLSIFLLMILCVACVAGAFYLNLRYTPNKLNAKQIVSAADVVTGITTNDKTVVNVAYDSTSNTVIYILNENFNQFESDRSLPSPDSLGTKITIRSYDLAMSKDVEILDLIKIFPADTNLYSSNLIVAGKDDYYATFDSAHKVIHFNSKGLIASYNLILPSEVTNQCVNTKSVAKYFVSLDSVLIKITKSDGSFVFISDSDTTKLDCAKGVERTGEYNSEFSDFTYFQKQESGEEFSFKNTDKGFRLGDTEYKVELAKNVIMNGFDVTYYRYNIHSKKYNGNYWIEDKNLSLPSNYIVDTPQGVLLLVNLNKNNYTSDGLIEDGIYLLTKEVR